MQNKKTIILAIISVLVVAFITVLVVRNITDRNEQPIIPEEVVAENDSSIEEGELGDYGKIINELELEELDVEFEELDKTVNEF